MPEQGARTVNVEHLIRQMEEQVRKLVKEYFDARIAQDLEPLFTHIQTLYEAHTEQAERLGIIEDQLSDVISWLTQLCTHLGLTNDDIGWEPAYLTQEEGEPDGG